MSKPTKYTVLIIENQLETLDVLIDALREKGIGVEVAGRGETALHWIETFHPDIIFSVFELSDMSATEFLHRAAGTPVVFTSDTQDLELLTKLLTSGAADYIAKPYNIDEVVARLYCRIYQHQQYQQLEQRTPQKEEAPDAGGQEEAAQEPSPLAMPSEHGHPLYSSEENSIRL